MLRAFGRLVRVQDRGCAWTTVLLLDPYIWHQRPHMSRTQGRIVRCSIVPKDLKIKNKLSTSRTRRTHHKVPTRLSIVSIRCSFGFVLHVRREVGRLNETRKSDPAQQLIFHQLRLDRLPAIYRSGKVTCFDEVRAAVDFCRCELQTIRCMK